MGLPPVDKAADDGTDPLVERAKDAIDQVFSDTSCSRADTLEKLREVAEHLDPMIEDLESDNG